MEGRFDQVVTREGYDLAHLKNLVKQNGDIQRETKVGVHSASPNKQQARWRSSIYLTIPSPASTEIASRDWNARSNHPHSQVGQGRR